MAIFVLIELERFLCLIDPDRFYISCIEQTLNPPLLKFWDRDFEVR